MIVVYLYIPERHVYMCEIYRVYFIYAISAALVFTKLIFSLKKERKKQKFGQTGNQDSYLSIIER